MEKNANVISIEHVLIEYKSLVYKAIIKRGVTSEFVDDLAQEIFIKIIINYEKYNASKGSLASWIWTVATNKSLDFFKSKGFKNTLKSSSILEGLNDKCSDLNADYSLDLEMKTNIIDSILSNLKPRHASIMRMYYIDGMSYKEIAAVLDLPSNRIGIEKSRAEAKLKTLVKTLGYRSNMFF